MEQFTLKTMSTKRAIILAAGMGTRLSKYTAELPKGMLAFNGKPLIEWQIETLRKVGISDINIVTGYHKEKIDFPSVTYYHNSKFSTTNMLESLMCAREKFDEDLLVSYADIIYTPQLAALVSESGKNISVAVDSDWRTYWQMRYGTTENDLESLTVRDSRIIELGKSVLTSVGLDYRYIGLLKFTKKGLETATQIYDTKKRKNESWIQSGKQFELGYMTDLLNEIILSEYEVSPVVSNGGWLEFDTNEDYEVQNNLFKSGLISPKFF